MIHPYSPLNVRFYYLNLSFFRCWKLVPFFISHFGFILSSLFSAYFSYSHLFTVWNFYPVFIWHRIKCKMRMSILLLECEWFKFYQDQAQKITQFSIYVTFFCTPFIFYFCSSSLTYSQIGSSIFYCVSARVHQ